MTHFQFFLIILVFGLSSIVLLFKYGTQESPPSSIPMANPNKDGLPQEAREDKKDGQIEQNKL
jgi:hypothetical protein